MSNTFEELGVAETSFLIELTREFVTNAARNQLLGQMPLTIPEPCLRYAQSKKWVTRDGKISSTGLAVATSFLKR